MGEIQLKPQEKALGIATNTDRVLRSGFSLGERMRVSSLRCVRSMARKTLLSKSEELLGKKQAFTFDASKYENKALAIKIKRTSSLEIN